MSDLTEILAETQANTGAAATGTQSAPKIIGLSNGNTLVAWTEGTSQGIANPPPGTEIIAKIYDAEGEEVRDSFRLNQFRTADNERAFDLAATNDGGFVMAFMDDDLNNVRTDVMWQRYDASGAAIHTATVRTETSGVDDLRNPAVTVNLDTNESFVTYTFDDNALDRVFGKLIGSTGAVGPQRSVAENLGGSDNRDAAVATLADGNMVVAYEEEDSGGIFEIEYQLLSATGTKIGGSKEVDGPAGSQADPNVVGLANGDFVITWAQSTDIWYQAFSPTGTSRGPAERANTSATNEVAPDIVALPDGGFVIAWDSGTGSARARNFDADGTARGPETQVSEDAPANIQTVHVDTTTEGVSLFAYRKSGEIFVSTFDGRADTLEIADVQAGLPNFLTDDGSFTGHPTGSTINGTDGANEIIGLDSADTINAEGGKDTVSAGKQADVIFGGKSRDVLNGNEGGDTINGQEAADRLFGGSGKDVINGGGGEDVLRGGSGRDRLNGGDDDDVLHGDVGGETGVDNLFGGDGDDILNGNADDDKLNGQRDDDRAFGGGGNDTITGGGGEDELFGGKGNDRLNGGEGDDTMEGGNGADDFVFKIYTPGERDVVTDFQTGTDELLLKSPVSFSVAERSDGVLIETANGHEIFLRNVDFDAFDAGRDVDFI